MSRGNKGERSELFALASLLVTGKLYISDESLTISDGLFFEISKIITSAESPEKMIYEIRDSEIAILDPVSGVQQNIERSAIKNKIISFLSEIRDVAGSDEMMAHTVASEMMQLLKAKKLSATSRHKADLKIESYDSRLGL